MADQYTPEEIQDIFDRYHDALRRGETITKSLAEEMANATKGVKNYTNNLNSSLRYLGVQTKALAQDLANGAKGASVFNGQLDAAGDVAANVASQFGLLGSAAGLAIKALTAWFTAVNKQSDALYSSYQKLSRTGSVGIQGMDDVFQSMQRMGYTIDELDQMASTLAENSKAFGLFTASAVDGTKQFGRISADIQNSPLRVAFFNLGMTVDDINKGIGGFMVQEGKLGRLRGQTDEQIRQGAKKYIEEMETLTRLTGMQRQELEEQRERAMQIDAFYASLDDLGPEAREQALQMFNQLSSISPKLAEEFARNFSGVITGATDMLLTSGGASMQFTKEYFARGGKAPEAMDGLAESMKGMRDVTKGIAQIGGDFGVSFRDLNMLLGKSADGFQKQYDAMGREIKAAEAGADKATDAQSRMRDSQIKSAQNMQDFINGGINPVTKAMKVLANAVEYLTNLLPFSGRAKARYEQEQQEQASAAAAKVTGGILDKIIQVESGGRNVGTAGSSAFGIGQMTRGTFEGLAKKATPGSALYGKTFEDMKSDVGLQREALSQLTTQNQTALGKAGVAVNDANTYLAHFLGSGGAVRVLQSADNTPIEAAVGGQAIAANPGVFRNIATVGDLKAWAAKKMGTEMSGAFGFQGTVSGPMSGYRPNLLMHGTEQLTVTPAGSSAGGSTATGGSGNISDLLARVDELIYVSKNQLSVNEKILKMQH